jgi:4-diphosphocytidyl-2-C-methyl-D-erythritol kinase
MDTIAGVITYKSYAKLNLFLNITHKIKQGANAGYHALQSIFTCINLYDEIIFEYKAGTKVNSGINRTINNPSNQYNDVSVTYEQDLIIKAAKLIEQYSNKKFNLNINITKNIPSGAGLGGGSSNAATAMIALNKIYNINLNVEQLCALAKNIGADVPYFIHQYYADNIFNAAWVEGIGDIIEMITIPKLYYILIKPNINSSTKDIFSHPELTLNSAVIKSKYANISCLNLGNSLAPLVLSMYSGLNLYIQQQFTKHNIKLQMTGSGSCFFAAFDNKTDSENAFIAIDKLDGYKYFNVF